ncbi:hypothetical protein CI109_100808 [Kwoniella shandongensis]|uniref:Uncharacterized protein n=1 Tax=Kwoniella shandongensis TaxID=1734106 RepID=A0A5M6BPC9_9TREE|nr:uncharacterized protein CI109_006898 [Kwoniella shandongensis]KAA5524744.1 hypothetical protein CI109_006898 [Kwoniella shandongensis]
MPTESTPSAPPPEPPHPAQMGIIKCSICGLGNFSSSTSTSSNECIVVLNDPIERICGRCVATLDARERTTSLRQDQENEAQSDGQSAPARSTAGIGLGLGLGLRGVSVSGENERRGSTIESGTDDTDSSTTEAPRPMDISSPTRDIDTPSPSQTILSHSLPAQHPQPWKTITTTATHSGTAGSSNKQQLPSPLTDRGRESTPSPAPTSASKDEVERPPNPLLDVTKSRVPNVGRGALYPGSVFKGTQTSGRSAYEVEVQLLDVNFAESTLSGYLSISHLTDSHPHLTTFFTGEIIGPKYGFITGSRFGATEHDDMRHWGRFEQFRRPATRQDMVRPELFFRDPVPDRSRGEMGKGKERDFVFLRIKERFLVPDHKVRDISGASFAGFYFAMVDLSPTVAVSNEPPSTPSSPTVPKTPLTPTSPAFSRRTSSTDPRNVTRPEGAKRRESSGKLGAKEGVRGEATMRGYYFHSLNQEPFQELFLTHVPAKSSSTFEFR